MSNFERSVFMESKVKDGFGRLPHGMVRQYYETGMPAKHALIMALGDHLCKNSWTTIPLSDKGLANYIGCSKGAIKQARNFYTKNRHLLEVVQHRDKDGELTRKYQYTMLTDVRAES